MYMGFMPRTPKLFSLDVSVVDALAERSKATGEAMSRIVEQGLRLALALPPPSQEDVDERTRGPTRSEVAALEVLKSLGPGPHLTFEIGNPAELSPGVAAKALRALERRGECFCWGAGLELSDGTFSLAWGLMHPMDFVRKVMSSWKGVIDQTLFQRLALVRKVSLAIDDVEPVRAFMIEQTKFPVSELEIENTRERVARLNAAERKASS
jgi:hypothetical protein